MEIGREYLNSSVRPLLIESGIPEAPLGIWGTGFLTAYRGYLFAVTAAHLVRKNQADSIYFLPSTSSKVRLPITPGFGIVGNEPEEEADLRVFPASLLGLRDKEVRRTRFLNLDSLGFLEWTHNAATSQLVVIGYPRERCQIDYDEKEISTLRMALPARYLGPDNGRSDTHCLEVSDNFSLTEFGGFSGSPVFSVEQGIGVNPINRFCGVAISGTTQSGKMHFVGALVLIKLMNSIIDHIAKFGLRG